ncbi:MAG: hypothetical protein EHM13_04410 [Acidobacteria bacterium]|nr:MAG: hypothetical protein EHM13_04410 [Acidobacteriota bacterium]
MPVNDLVAFAERVLALLDQGSFVATYKYAVLLALMDLCLEGTRRDGSAPDCVTTRQLAQKVVELYWPHTGEFGGRTLRFYCGSRLTSNSEVDHFIPWARYPDNGIDNLVVAEMQCNAAKRDYFAAPPHLGNWRERNRCDSFSLVQIAQHLRWETHPAETLGVARGLYFQLPAGARLWVRRREFYSAACQELSDSLS